MIAASAAVLTPDQVAEATVVGLAEERFLILPHPEVATYARRRVEDPDGWQAGLRKLVRKLRDRTAGDAQAGVAERTARIPIQSAQPEPPASVGGPPE